MAFLTFEGIDGSGKSTLMKLLAEHLKGLGLPVEMTRQPGGTSLGTELRDILLRTKGSPPSPEAELLIYEADRAHHVATAIRPWLQKKVWVLCDRYADSSLAFQGAGRQISKNQVRQLNEFATQGLKPDLTVLVDCPVEVSVKRRQLRQTNEKTKADRFENERREFHQAVRDEFLALAKAEPDRFVVLNSEKEPQSLLTELIQEMKGRKLL
jgi:dTMP kinase